MNIAKIKQITDRYFIKHGYIIAQSYITTSLSPNIKQKYEYRCSIINKYIHRGFVVPFNKKSDLKNGIKNIFALFDRNIEFSLNSIMDEFNGGGYIELKSEVKEIRFKMHLIGYNNQKAKSAVYYKFYNIKLNESEIENLRDKMYECFNDFYNSEIERSVHR